MFIGTTVAWFTDSVTSGVNQIIAGNLDVEVEYSTNGSTWADLQDASSLFSGDRWEPGHTEIVYLKITNKGTLALKYKLNVTPINERGGINQNDQPFKLSDYLVFGTTTPSATLTTYTRDAARAAVGITAGLNQSALSKAGALGANETSYTALVVYMPETVGNEANYKTGTTPPQIELGITVLATQNNVEADSFGPDYDVNADLSPDKVDMGDLKYNYTAQVNQTGMMIIHANGTEHTTQGATATTGTDDVVTQYTIKSVALIDGTPVVTAVVPADSVDWTTNVDGTKSAEVKVTVDEADDTPTGITVGDNQSTKVMEINVTGVDFSSGKTITMDVFYGKGRKGLTLYHNATAMTAAASKVEVDRADEYYYNPDDGFVTICIDHCSPFTAVYTTPEAEAMIGATTYESIHDALDAANDGDTVVLLKDIELEYSLSIEKNITLDLGNRTIEHKNQSLGYMISVEDGATVTIKNGTVQDYWYYWNWENEWKSYYTYTIWPSSGANLTLENLNVKGGYYCIYQDGVNITLNNSSLTPENNAILLSDSTLTINEGTTINASNDAVDAYGDSEVIMNGGTIKSEGCGIQSNGTSRIIMNGGTIKSGGRGIQSNETSSIIMNGGTINSDQYGILVFNTSTLTLNGGSISAPKVGIHLTADASMVMNGGTIYSSDVAINMLMNSNLRMENGTIAAKYGIYIAGSEGCQPVATVNGGEIQVTSVDGSGVYVSANVAYTDGKVGAEDTRTSYPATANINGGWIHSTFALTEGMVATDSAVSVRGKGAEVNVSGTAKLEAYAFPIVGNGTHGDNNDYSGTKIKISGGTLESKVGPAIYHPQYGELTITGGSLIGESSGLEIRAGELTVSGGTITGNRTPTETRPNGSGITTFGAGIAIAQHGTKLPITVNISGGTVNGCSALYQSNPQNNPQEDIDKVTISVTGGTFHATNGGTVAVYSENKTGFITGGTFSSDPAAYLASGYTAANENGMWAVDEN